MGQPNRQMEVEVSTPAMLKARNTRQERFPRVFGLAIPLLAVVLGIAVGCESTETVFIDRALFDDPPDASNPQYQ